MTQDALNLREKIYKSGFYGAKIGELTDAEIREIVERGEADLEVVTEESVEQARKSMDPADLQPVPLGSIGAGRPSCAWRVRLKSDAFMSSATRGRFKFNCSEYFFIFDELLRSNGEMDCGALRLKLKIGAKSFFYFVKKLKKLRLVQKSEATNSIRLVWEDEVREEGRARSPPTGLHHNVPLYKQVHGLLMASDEGLCTQDLQAIFGIGVKPGLTMLKKMHSRHPSEIVSVMEFEGKLRRLRYMRRSAHDAQRRECKAKFEEEQPSACEKRGKLAVDVRTSAIEELVRKEKVLFYDKHFCRALSALLNSSHQIDKNTVLRTARSSAVIKSLRVMVRYPNQRVSRNVLLLRDIPDGDRQVLSLVKKAGYRRFDILTSTGILEVEDSAQREESSDEEGGAHVGEASLQRMQAMRDALLDKYRLSGVENGYKTSLRERLCLFAGHLLRKRAGGWGGVDYRLVEEMDLDLFFSLFQIDRPGVRLEILQAFGGDAGDGSASLRKTYGDVLCLKKKSAARGLTLKNYLKPALSYMHKLSEVGVVEAEPPCLRGNDGKRKYRLAVCDPDAIRERVSSVKEARQACERYVGRTLRRAAFSRIRAELLQRGAAGDYKVFVYDMCDLIKREDIGAEEKRALIFTINLAKEKRGPSAKKERGLSYNNEIVGASKGCPVSIEIGNRRYPSTQIMQIIRQIKRGLVEKTLNILEDFPDEDAVAIEYALYNLHQSRVIHYPQIHSLGRNLYLDEISLDAELMQRLTVEESYLEAFCVDVGVGVDERECRGSESPLGHKHKTVVQNYLLHNGSSYLRAVQSKLGVIYTFEIEEVAESHPDVFRITRDGPHSIISLL